MTCARAATTSNAPLKRDDMHYGAENRRLDQFLNASHPFVALPLSGLSARLIHVLVLICRSIDSLLIMILLIGSTRRGITISRPVVSSLCMRHCISHSFAMIAFRCIYNVHYPLSHQIELIILIALSAAAKCKRYVEN